MLYLVNTPLACSGNGSNVEGNVITTTLPGQTGVGGLLMVSVVGMIMVVMVIMSSSGSTALVEGEGVDEGLALAGASSLGGGGHKDQEAEL